MQKGLDSAPSPGSRWTPSRYGGFYRTETLFYQFDSNDDRPADCSVTSPASASPTFPTTWKGVLSHYATAPLRAWHRRRVTAVDPPITSFPAWDRRSERLRNWLGYHVRYRTAVALRSRFPANGPLAALNAIPQSEWSLTTPTLLYLWQHCQTHRPRRIIELGSGISTSLFALYAIAMRKQSIDVQITSLDHDARWLAETQTALAQLGDSSMIHLRHAPITEQPLLGRSRPAYTVAADELARLAGPEGFDLCLIDGPPGHYGRAGGLAVVAPWLAKQSVVLLDDAVRNTERAALTEWQATWPEALGEPQLVLTDHHGLAVIPWRGPGPVPG